MPMSFRRRELVTLLGGAAAMAIVSARAQQPPTIGILSALALTPIADRVDAFLEGLKASGFVEMRDVAIEYRSAESRPARLPALAAELVQLKSNVIACLASVNTVQAAKAATSTIPIVFAVSGDPIELGLVTNLRAPEANVTGAARPTEDLNPDRLKVICELVPQATRVGFLIHSRVSPPAVTEERNRRMTAAAKDLGRELVVIDLAEQSELVSIFAGMTH